MKQILKKIKCNKNQWLEKAFRKLYKMSQRKGNYSEQMKQKKKFYVKIYFEEFRTNCLRSRIISMYLEFFNRVHLCKNKSQASSITTKEKTQR
jgi:hypothetical protein